MNYKNLLCAWFALAPALTSGAPADSVYTTLSLAPDECELERMDRESGYSVNRCRGAGGYNLLVEYSDDRMDATVEAPNGRQFPLRLGELVGNGFSTLGDKAEWRITKQGGQITPFALIVRFSPEEEHGIVQYLTVSKLGPDAACLTAVIPPQRKHNQKAREAAALAPNSPCYGAPPPPPGLARIRREAEAGSPSAQRELGLRYQKGQGVTQDYQAALTWYRQAAKQGYDVAQNDLGYLFGNGVGVPKDLAKARHWYGKAAAQGNAVAAQNLKAIGAAPEAACPDPIRTRQGLASAHPGWDEAVDQMPNSLLFVNFFEGAPSNGRLLGFDRSAERARLNEYSEEWEFPPRMRGRVWVSCVYADTGVSLIRRLPPAMGGCRITYSSRLESAGYPTVLETQCQ